MKNKVKSAVCALYKYCGLMWLQETLTRMLYGSSLAILVFHRVTDDLPEDDLTIGTARFDALCKMLARRFHVVSLADAFQSVRSGKPFPWRTVAITFDDGYADNLFAARILAHHRLPACFFITTSFMSSSRDFAWDEGAPQIPKLTWDEVREIKRMGFEIGSHTHTHPDLGAIPLDPVRHELAESKRILESRLGERVRWFAFPFGREECFPRDRWPLVEEAGYEGGVSVFNQFVYAGADPRMLPRHGVPVCSPLVLEVQLSGCLGWLHVLRKKLRGSAQVPTIPSAVIVPERAAPEPPESETFAVKA